MRGFRWRWGWARDHGCIVAKWGRDRPCMGTAEAWNLVSGSQELWFTGTVVHRNCGSQELWFTGTVVHRNCGRLGGNFGRGDRRLIARILQKVHYMSYPRSLLVRRFAALTMAFAAWTGWGADAVLGQPSVADPEAPLGESTEAAAEPLVVRARIAGRPGHRDVREIRVFLRDAGRMDWSAQGDKIVFDRPNPTDAGFYDLYETSPDGTRERCISCDNLELYKKHALAPVWHPAGEYLVFQVQIQAKRLKMPIEELATPYRGLHSEIWAITADGKETWELTKARDRGGSVLDPIFSFEADRLVWSERLTTHGGRRYGQWASRIAEFEIKRGVPRVGKITTAQVGAYRGLEMAQAFTPDDQGLLVTGSPQGQPDDGLDVIRYSLTDNTFQPLTATPDFRDDVARYAPDSRHIVWASNRGIASLAEGRRRLPWRNDLWIMRDDGGQQERLTFFNHPESAEKLGEAMITDIAWSPEGDRLLLHVVTAGLEIEQAIWVVVLDEKYRRGL